MKQRTVLRMMLRRIFTATATIVNMMTVPALLAFSVRANADELRQTLTFSTSDLTLYTSNGYTVAALPGGYFMNDTTKLGYPDVPLKKISLVLPNNSKIDSLKVDSSSSQNVNGTYLLYPIQHNRYPDGSSAPPFVLPDSVAYSSNNPFPGTIVEIVRDGYMRQFHLINLNIYPVQYIPGQRRLVLYTNIVFSIFYSGGSLGPLGGIGGSLPAEELKSSEEGIIKMVQNKKDVLKFETKTPVPISTSRIVRRYGVTSLPSLQGEQPKYLIITNNYRLDGTTYIGDAVTEFQRLADWKTQKGCPTVVRSVSWIRANYPGCDVQEQIRHFIQDAYKYWQIDWVLLGGGTEIVPCRDIGYDQRPTDLYYADLEGNWDPNGDGIFDAGDMFPEVWVGRAPIHSSQDVHLLVDKTFTYERNSLAPSLPPGDYLSKFLSLGGWLWQEDWYDPYTCWYIGVWIKEQVRMNSVPSTMTVWRNYEWDPNYYQNCYDKDEILNATTAKGDMDQGYGIINHIDHGQPYLLNTAQKYHGGGSLFRSTMDALANGNKYGIFYTAACSPAAMDYNSVGEHYLLSSGGGGPAFIGCSRSVLSIDANHHDYEFFKTIFAEGYYHLGEALGRTPNTYESATLYNLLGDPELPVWTDHPHTMVVQHPSSIAMGPQQITVTVLDASQPPPPYPPLPNALVCLKKGTNLDQGLEAYAYGYTNQNGQITFTYQPETPGDLKVTVTAHNFGPYEGTCTVGQGVATPYVFPAVAGRTYLDVPPGGNGDGQPNPGETMNMTVALTNSGNADANNVSAVISTTDSYITITKSGANYGTILQNHTVVNTSDPFTIAISNQCPDVYDAQINMTITASGGYQWTDHFTVTVLADSLRFVGHGPGGEVLNQQYTIANLGIKNNGSGAAAGIVATLQANPDSVRIDDNSSVFGAITAHGTVVSTDPFTYTVLLPPQSPYHLGFSIHMVDGYGGREWVKYFVFDPPSAPPSQPTLKAAQTSVDLLSSVNPSPYVIGYNIYRATTSGGPYTKVNASLVEGTAHYFDMGLAPTTEYYYVTTAVDTSAYFESQPGWQSALFAGVSAGRRGNRVQIVTHPLWIRDIANISGWCTELTNAYTAASNAGATNIEFKSVFDLLRRPYA